MSRSGAEGIEWNGWPGEWARLGATPTPLHHSGVNQPPTTQIRVNLVPDAEVTTLVPPLRSCFIFMCILGGQASGAGDAMKFNKPASLTSHHWLSALPLLLFKNEVGGTYIYDGQLTTIKCPDI